MGKTTGEILAELAKDKKFQKEKKEREKRMRAIEKKLDADEKPVIKDLSKVGVNVSSVWDLVNTNKSYEKAIPVLLRHLEKKYHPKTSAGIARALAVPETNNFPEAWGCLLKLYKNTKSEEAISEPELRGFKEGLAVALSVLCNSDRLEDILLLIKEKKHGESRVLLIDGLSRYRSKTEVQALLESLISDGDLIEISKEILNRNK